LIEKKKKNQGFTSPEDQAILTCSIIKQRVVIYKAKVYDDLTEAKSIWGQTEMHKKIKQR